MSKIAINIRRRPATIAMLRHRISQKQVEIQIYKGFYGYDPKHLQKLEDELDALQIKLAEHPDYE